MPHVDDCDLCHGYGEVFSAGKLRKCPHCYPLLSSTETAAVLLARLAIKSRDEIDLGPGLAALQRISREEEFPTYDPDTGTASRRDANPIG